MSGSGKKNLEIIQTVLQHSKNGKGGRLVLIKGMDHQNFCDAPYLASPYILRAGKVIGKLDREAGLSLMGSNVVPFLINNWKGLSDKGGFYKKQLEIAAQNLKRFEKVIAEEKTFY